MKKFSIIEVSDPRWKSIISRSTHFDFYHTQTYHLLEREHRPVLCTAKFDDDFIALPLIIRKIPDSSFYDCTSVYGYCGPVSNLAFENISLEDYIYFKEQLIDFFNKNCIVSVFSRLHPLINTTSFFTNFGEVENLNKTIAIDLSLSLEEQWSQYRKSYRRQVPQLRNKHEFEVFEAKTREDIDAFISIYHENMSRVNAANNYFFNNNYFYTFLNSSCFETKLLLAKKDGEIAAGAIFTITNKIMQDHLAATKSKFSKYSPLKLVTDEARLIGEKMNLDYLHLGGGLGGRDDDSLFHFKAGFSNVTCQFQIWKLIVDEQKYNQLVLNNSIDRKSKYFPLYRDQGAIKMYIFGASGHGRVIANILQSKKIDVIGFIDDNPKATELIGLPVLDSKEFNNLSSKNIIIGVGDNTIRKDISKRFKSNYMNLVHPSSVICKSVKIGIGSVVFPCAVINSDAEIGMHCIVNTGAIVEHDCIVEDFVHLSPNVALAGGVKIGEGTHVGTGACVIPGVTIGKWVTVGAGAVVIRDVPNGAVVVGNPAHVIRTLEYI